MYISVIIICIIAIILLIKNIGNKYSIEKATELSYKSNYNIDAINISAISAQDAIEQIAYIDMQHKHEIIHYLLDDRKYQVCNIDYDFRYNDKSVLYITYKNDNQEVKYIVDINMLKILYKSTSIIRQNRTKSAANTYRLE